MVLIAWGILSVKLFKFPSWVTPAIAFNNTTALPLLLVQSLDSAGILDGLLKDSNDTPSDAVNRAATYLLINSVIANCLTFAVGPQMLNAHEEDAPSSGDEKDDESNGQEDGQQSQPPLSPETLDERSTLLPRAINKPRKIVQRKVSYHSWRIWNTFPSWLQATLDFLFQFFNASVIAALLGLVVGLVPALHKAFFSDAKEGGIFNAWFTVSLKNTGDLFAALQTFTVGIKLRDAVKDMGPSTSTETADSDDDSKGGGYPWFPSLFVEITRHVIVPAISIPVIWFVATKTNWLAPDPVLWFSMMIIPTGPPATKLTALADVSNYSDQEKKSISKFMAVSYVVSPVMAFAIVGSLQATRAPM